jgi:hypothetical protein
MEVTFSSEMSVDFQQTTRCYVPENTVLHNHCCDYLKSYKTWNWVTKVGLLMPYASWQAVWNSRLCLSLRVIQSYSWTLLLSQHTSLPSIEKCSSGCFHFTDGSHGNFVVVQLALLMNVIVKQHSNSVIVSLPKDYYYIHTYISFPGSNVSEKWL